MSINVPASIGMPIEEIDTPCLLLDLDAFERNVAKMGELHQGERNSPPGHAKCHKSADIAAYLMEKGGTCGVCCQKVSEAEAMVSGGVRDILVSNEVTTPKKIERLAALATRARVLVCVDDLANVDDLSAAAQKYGVTIECLVEIDVRRRPLRRHARRGGGRDRQEDRRRSRPQVRRPAGLSRQGPARLRLSPSARR